MLDARRAREQLHGKTKKPLIPDRINGFQIWLRGQDLNL
jgi:hypothetical protein